MKAKRIQWPILAITLCLSLALAVLLVSQGLAANEININGLVVEMDTKKPVSELNVSSDNTKISFQIAADGGITTTKKTGAVNFINDDNRELTVQFMAWRQGSGSIELRTSEYDTDIIQVCEDNPEYFSAEFFTGVDSELFTKYKDYAAYSAAVRQTIDEIGKQIKIELSSGEQFSIVITSSDKDTSPCIAMLDSFSVSTGDAISVNLQAPEVGSYTATSGETNKEVTTGGADDTIQFTAADGLTLSYTPDTNRTDTVFDCWVVKDKDGQEKTVSYDDTNFKFSGFKDGDTVCVQMKQKDQFRYFAVSNRRYFDWESAMRAAKAAADEKNADVTVILRGDYTLPTVVGEGGTYAVQTADGQVTYKIPAGVRFVVPRSDIDIGSFTTSIATKEESGGDDNVVLQESIPRVFRTLTIPSGVTMEVNGVLNVNATITGRNRYQAIVSGNYGKIRLEKNAQIILENKSKLYCYGFITGDGIVTAESGAISYEPLQITDWGGGSEAAAFVGTTASKGQNAFYFSQYYVQNIESEYRVNYGANAMAVGIFRAKLGGVEAFLSADTDYISDKGLFRLKEGSYLVRTYHADTDRTSYDIYGDLETGSITVSLSTVALNSKDWALGLNGNLDMNIKSGKTTLNADYMILPGVKIHVDKGATLTVAENALVTVWNANDWYIDDTDIGKALKNGQNITGSIAFTHNGNLAPVYYTTADQDCKESEANTAAKTYRKAQREKFVPAEITVDGTLYTYSNIYMTDLMNTVTNGQFDSKQDCIKGTGTIINQENHQKHISKFSETGTGDDRRATLDYDESKFVSTENSSIISPVVSIGGMYCTINAHTVDDVVIRGYYTDLGVRFITVPIQSTVIDGAAGSGALNTIQVGTYYGSGDGWYQHHVTWTLNDTDGKQIAIKDVYYSSNEVVLPSEVDGQKYYYTNVAADNVITAVCADADNANKLGDGWASVKLENVGKDAAVTVTATLYQSHVTWKHYLNDFTDSSCKEKQTVFLASNDPATFEWAADDGALTTGNIRVKAANGTDITGQVTVKTTRTDDKYSVTVSGFTGDITVEFMTVAGSIPVNVYYKMPNESSFALWSTYSATKSEGSEAFGMSNIKITEDSQFASVDGYYLVDSVAGDANGIPITGANVQVAANGAEVSVQNATGIELNIYLTLVKFDYKVSFDKSTATEVSIAPVYINANETKTIDHENGVQNTGSQRYYFTGASAAGCEVSYGDGSTLTISDVKADTTVNVSMAAYKYQIEIKYSKGSTVLGTLYIENGKENSYSTYIFESNINLNKIKSGELYEWLEGDKAAQNVIPLDAEVGDDLRITAALIKVANVSQDGTLLVDAQRFKHAVRVEKTRVEYFDRVTEGFEPTTESIFVNDDFVDISLSGDEILKMDSVSAAGGAANAKAAEDGKSVNLTGLTENARVQFTTYAYANSFSWTVNGNTVTDYLQLNEDETKATTAVTVGSADGMGERNYAYDAEGLFNATYTAPEGSIISRYDNMVVENGASCTPEISGNTVRLAGIDNGATTSITLEQKAYAHTVTFVNAGGKVLKTVYVDANGYDARYTNSSLAEFAENGKYIQSYTVAPEVDVTLDDKNPVGSLYGWTKLSIPAAEAAKQDLTVTLTLEDYQYTIQWTVTGGTNEWHYVTDPAKDVYHAPAGKMIYGATNAAISDDKTFATYSGTESGTATITLTDEKPMVTYTVDGGAEQSAQSDGGSWSYTVSENGKIINTVTITGDANVQTVNTLTELKVSNITASIRVAITLKDKPDTPTILLPEQKTDDEGNLVAFDGFTSLWGDMSYQYYKNSSVYAYDAEKGEFVFKPGNTYAWRNAPGSKTYTVNMMNNGKVEAQDITVPNGSILLLNCSDKAVSYTVMLDKSAAAERTDWAIMKWAVNGETYDNTVTVTVQPGQQVLVTGTMTGTTNDFGLNNVSVGHITVGAVSIG